jgi:nucleoside-diphosphate-sugar epimerase
LEILVLGGCGFTGSVLVADLLKNGHRVTVFDSQWFGSHLESHPSLQIVQGDIRDTNKIPFKNKDAVIHLANVANDPSVDLNPNLSWEINVLATMGIAEGCIREGVKKLIFASSGSVYGVKDEDRVTEDLELVPISVYNKTKMIAERVLLSYKDKINVYIVRPATVCGLSPRMRLDLSVNLLTFQALTKKEITVFGGSQTRPNIHIKDLSLVYQHLLFSSAPPGIYNAGFENMSISDLANLIAEKIDAKLVFSESNDIRSYRQDSGKLLATGFKPKYSVESAIDELVQAFDGGTLRDNVQWHTVQAMTQLGVG